MDALVRAEFERKDEAIRTLHNIVETQVRSLQAALKQEELARNQFESYLRDEMGRFQDDTRRVSVFFFLVSPLWCIKFLRAE